jgi:hypothetical protein
VIQDLRGPYYIYAVLMHADLVGWDRRGHIDCAPHSHY